MINQYIWIGITVSIFFVGIGIGYAVLQSNTTTVPMIMTPQQMQRMMNDPKQMTQWNQQMMNNPQATQQFHNMMINDPQHMNQMVGPMMNSMMNDQQMRQQMMNMMMRNQSMMNTMMQNQPMTNTMMGNNMTGSGMMSGNMMMGNMTGIMNDNMMIQLMQDPKTRKEMIELMKEHISEMDELLSSNLTDEEFNMKIEESMQEHMQSMQDLMPSHQMTGMMNPDMMDGNMTGSMIGSSMMERGDIAMGFNQTKIMHHFVDTPTGGEIMIITLDGSDVKTISEIRAHVKEIQHEFSQGNFTKPFFIHAQVVPGTKVMTEKKDLIRYSTRQIEGGEILVLTTNDIELLDAIKQFMDFQSNQHMGH